MKRNTIIKRIIKTLKKNDVIVVSGKWLSNVVSELDDDRMFYFDELGKAQPFGIGLSIVNNKRIFVICEDVDLIRNFSLMAQAASVRRTNLFFIVIGCGRHQDTGGQPSIFLNMNTPKAVLFNMGIIVHDFTPHFKKHSSINILAGQLFKDIRGPMVIFIKCDKGLTKSGTLELEPIEMKERFEKFVQNLELGTSLFIP